MSKKLTIEDIRNKSDNIHKTKYIIKDQSFENNKSKIEIKCVECGYIFFQQINNHINRGDGCPKCYGKNKKTINEIRDLSKKIHGNIYEIPEQKYINMKSKIQILCKKCNTYFSQSSNNHIYQKQGCVLCNGNNKLSLQDIVKKDTQNNKEKFEIPEQEIKNTSQKIKIYCNDCKSYFYRNINSHINRKSKYCPNCSPVQKLTLKKIREKSLLLHKGKYIIPDQTFVNNTSFIKIYCKKCKQIYKQKIMVHLDNRIKGCNNCKCSKGEITISNILKNNKIDFITQKRFKNCRYKLPLPFDFYLTEKNLCIEYDGELHYISKDYFGGDEKLKETQRNDKIKTEYCEKNKIKLLRIKYDENIIEKLKEIM